MVVKLYSKLFLNYILILCSMQNTHPHLTKFFALIPGNCECDLTWQSRIKVSDEIRLLISRPENKQIIQVCPV